MGSMRKDWTGGEKRKEKGGYLASACFVDPLEEGMGLSVEKSRRRRPCRDGGFFFVWSFLEN